MKRLDTEQCTEEREARRGLQFRTKPASMNMSGKCPPELSANGVFQEAEGNEKEGRGHHTKPWDPLEVDEAADSPGSTQRLEKPFQWDFVFQFQRNLYLHSTDAQPDGSRVKSPFWSLHVFPRSVGLLCGYSGFLPQSPAQRCAFLCELAGWTRC